MTAALLSGADQANPLWDELKAKREKLPGFHQEFESSAVFTSAISKQIAKERVILDGSGTHWREVTDNGIRIFDGTDLFQMEDDIHEYVWVKRNAKMPDPLPEPYGIDDPEWQKATEISRRPCGFKEIDHVCVIVQVPLKPWTKRPSPRLVLRMTKGEAQAAFDTETGLLVSMRTVQFLERNGRAHKQDIVYTTKRLNYGAPSNSEMFQMPQGQGWKEVKELAKWDSVRIKKALGGKSAPDMELTDIEGKPVSLSALHGKIVVLDLWATWCPPCRDDAPALDKLHSKFGGKDLEIVAISLGEERAIVEKFLKRYPHDFPVVLESENTMPHQFLSTVLPTYIVIDKDGKVFTAMQGAQKMTELRKALQKAGLDPE